MSESKKKKNSISSMNQSANKAKSIQQWKYFQNDWFLIKKHLLGNFYKHESRNLKNLW